MRCVKCDKEAVTSHIIEWASWGKDEKIIGHCKEHDTKQDWEDYY